MLFCAAVIAGKVADLGVVVDIVVALVPVEETEVVNCSVVGFVADEMLAVVVELTKPN